VESKDREWLWNSLTNTETPDIALNSQGHADAYVQIWVESGTGVVGLEGTDLVDVNNLPIQFVPVLTANGAVINTASSLRAQLQNLPQYFRPVFVSGAGVVTFLVKGRGKGA